MHAHTRRFFLNSALIFSGLAVLSPAFAIAAERPTPSGPVVLTIAGDIAHTNRGPSDKKRDGFMAYHEISFDKAFALDLSMLEGFPLKEITAQPPQYTSNVTFRGPLLKDVLKAIGAEGKPIKTRALDGFAVDLTVEQVAAKDWILATHANGKPFGIGDKGPVWMMHTPSALKVAEEEEQSWPWAVFYIDVGN